MFKRILVPTDVSEYSRKAFITALKIAKEFNAEIELFHVTYTPQEYYGFQMSQDQINELGEAALEAALSGIDVGDVPIHKKHSSGYPATAILEEIKRDIDLVVMGSHGYGIIAGAVIGSVTQHVLAQAHCPVLVVK